MFSVKPVALLLALLLATAGFAREREYVIVVHGGAGEMKGLEADPDMGQMRGISSVGGSACGCLLL